VSALTRFVIALVCLASGCSSSNSPAAGTATFSEIYSQIFPQQTKGQCSFCHGLPPNEKSNGLLSTGGDRGAAYQALVNQTSTSAKCGGKSYVIPGRPDESLLLLKLTTPGCGDRMPLGGDPLTSAQLEMVRSWIAAGAQDD
jgi:hypothetical protein